MKPLLLFYSGTLASALGFPYPHVNVLLPDCNKLINCSFRKELAGVINLADYPYPHANAISLDNCNEERIARAISLSAKPMSFLEPWRNCYSVASLAENGSLTAYKRILTIAKAISQQS